MAATSVNNNDHVRTQRLLTEAQLYLTSGNDDETAEVESSIQQFPETSLTIRQYSDLSIMTPSLTVKKGPSRSYKLAQLERALLTAKLLKTYDDRMKFENDCLIALQEDTFDQFADNYYKKIHDHYEHIKKEEEKKQTRRFTLLDLEKKFLALYPTRDIKIIFIDEPNSSTTTTKRPNARSASAHPKSASLGLYDDEAIESFYANFSRRHLFDTSPANSEVESFARRAAQSLHERLPRMSTIPRRVKVIDERDPNKNSNEHAVLEMNHKRALSLITKRRRLVVKMMTQTKKNQIKMDQKWKPTPIGVDNSTCYREILERTNEIEEVYREKPIDRPQTAISSRRIPNKNIFLSASMDIPTMRVNTSPSISSCLTPFQDSLTLNQVESTKNVRVMFPTRPLTAPTKMKWVNYC